MIPGVEVECVSPDGTSLQRGRIYRLASTRAGWVTLAGVAGEFKARRFSPLL